MRGHSTAFFLLASLLTSGCSNNNAPIKPPQWNTVFGDTLLRDFLGMRQQQDGDVVMAWHHDGQLHYQRVSTAGVAASLQVHAMGRPGLGITDAYAMADDATLVETGGRDFFLFDQDDTLQHHFSWSDLGYPNPTLVAVGGDRICFNSDSNSVVTLRCIQPDGQLIWEFILPGITRAHHQRHGTLDDDGQLYFSYGNAAEEWHLMAFAADGSLRWQWSEQPEAYPSIQAIDVVGDTVVMIANVEGEDNVERTHVLHVAVDGVPGAHRVLERDIEYARLQAFNDDHYMMLEEHLPTDSVFMSLVNVDGTEQWRREVPAGGVGMGSGGIHNMGARLDGAGNILVMHNVRSTIPALVHGVLGLSVVDNFTVTRYNDKGNRVKQDVISRSRYKLGELGQIFDGEFGFSAFNFVAHDGHYYVATGDIPPGQDPQQPFVEALVPSLKAYPY